jgi:hypothetical protein
LSKLSNPQTQEHLLDIIRQWQQEATASNGPLGGQDDQHVPLQQASIESLIEERLKQAIKNAEELRKPAKRAPSKKGRKSKEEEGYGDLDDHSDQEEKEDVGSSKEEENDNASYRWESEQPPKENQASRQSQSSREDSATSVSSVEQESIEKRLQNVLAAKLTAEPEEVESDDEWW